MLNKEKANELYEKYSHIPKVVYAKYFKHNKIKREELIQEGSLELWRAIQNYTEDKEESFQSYLYTCVSLAMKRYLKDDQFMKIPNNMRLNSRKAKTMFASGFDEKHIMSELNLTHVELSELNIVTNHDSIYRNPTGEDSEGIILNTIINNNNDPCKLTEVELIKEHTYKIADKAHKDGLRVYTCYMNDMANKDAQKLLGIGNTQYNRILAKVRNEIALELKEEYEINDIPEFKNYYRCKEYK